MRNALLLSLGLFLSDANGNSFENLPKPSAYNGFTVTVEYDLNADTDIIERFYGEIMDLRPKLNYYKIGDSNLPNNKFASERSFIIFGS